jgi:hypothetical protein
MDEALQEAIRGASGVVALARALGVSHQAVSRAAAPSAGDRARHRRFALGAAP